MGRPPRQREREGEGPGLGSRDVFPQGVDEVGHLERLDQVFVGSLAEPQILSEASFFDEMKMIGRYW